MKRCTGCELKKPATLKYFGPHNGAKDGLQTKCRKCRSIDYKKYRKTDSGKKARRRANLKIRLKKGPIKERGRRTPKEYHLKSKYGITLGQHKQMYVDQNGCCAICEMLIEYHKMYTDHDHNTGEVRGLLCINCNTGIGMLKDNVDIVHRALCYLSK